MNSLAIHYSRGRDSYDNEPTQLSADNFAAFTEHVVADRSPAKGRTYFCGPLSLGPHDRPSDYPNPGHYRLASHALPRRFIAIDFDAFKDPETFASIFGDFETLSGFGYTTWSHTDEVPRARAVFELSREVARAEGMALGHSLSRLIATAYGEDAVYIDKSVYQNEQPVFTPGPAAHIYYFPGKPVDVDMVLAKFPEPAVASPLMNTKHVDDEGSGSAGSRYARLTLKSLEQVLSRIDCDDEPTWFEVGNALARAYGEGVRGMFHRFSSGELRGRICVKYDEAETNNRFSRALDELFSRPDGYGVRYLIHLTGLDSQSLEFEADESVISQGAPQAVFPTVRADGKPKQVSENLEAVIAACSIIVRYNQIKKLSEVLIPSLASVLDEADNTALNSVIDCAVRAGMTPTRIPEMLSAIAAQRPFCPVQQYITLKPWDGTPRFDRFLHQIVCSDPIFAGKLWRRWLIQAVAAVFEPHGIANAGVIVLTGAQGVGKTRLLSDLASGVPGVFLEGQTLNPADKDSVMTAVSHWIVELGELDATFRKADLAQLKAFITKRQDTLRRPYARKDSMFPRRTVFAGTVNDFEFLHDPTGNRRFWPIHMTAFVRDESIDYQQLWAEVNTWYEAGEKWYLSPTEMQELEKRSRAHVVADPDVEALLATYKFEGCERWTEQTMSAVCLSLSILNPTRSTTMRLAAAIRKHNGGRLPRESNGVKYHVVPDLTVAKPVVPVGLSGTFRHN
jgi:hypothetical protein